MITSIRNFWYSSPIFYASFCAAAFCFLVDLSIALSRLPRDPLHVLVFRVTFFGAVGLLTGFDADSTAWDPDFEEAAGQGGALDAVAADADGGGLPEEDGVQGADLVFGAENGQLVGRAVFLMKMGVNQTSRAPGFEEEIQGVARLLLRSRRCCFPRSISFR